MDVDGNFIFYSQFRVALQPLRAHTSNFVSAQKNKILSKKIIVFTMMVYSQTNASMATLGIATMIEYMSAISSPCLCSPIVDISTLLQCFEFLILFGPGPLLFLCVCMEPSLAILLHLSSWYGYVCLCSLIVFLSTLSSVGFFSSSSQFFLPFVCVQHTDYST